MKNPHKILGLILICLSLSVVHSYADSVYGTMWKQEDTVVYPADDVTKVDFNNISTVNMLGAGSDCTTDCTFDNISTGTITTGRVLSGAGTAALPSVKVGSEETGLYSSGTDKLDFTTLGFLRFRIDGTTFSGNLNEAGGVLNETASATNPTLLPRKNEPTTGVGTSGLYQVSIISNSRETMRSYTTHTVFYPTVGGYIQVNGGIYTAFRNLSSAAETLTGEDYTVFCLANDNEVVATMPLCSGQSYSQQLMVVYTDSGSTNKCKLDGNGSETVANFSVYSGLDTFEEGCHFACDGSGNWWRVGCF